MTRTSSLTDKTGLDLGPRAASPALTAVLTTVGWSRREVRSWEDTQKWIPSGNSGSRPVKLAKTCTTMGVRSVAVDLGLYR